MALRETPSGPAPEARPKEATSRTVFLVGSPNVGKSVLFGALTGSYAVVSNYPGTTVEVSRGSAEIGGETWEVVDTPGMYSLRPITEEERVASGILLKGSGPIVHVLDAKNLPRMLPLTLELCQLGRPVAVVLNLMDEAERSGVRIDAAKLASALGVPVVETVATKGKGVAALKALLAGPLEAPPAPEVRLPERGARALEILKPSLPEEAWRFWAVHHLLGDPGAREVAPVDPGLVEAALCELGGEPRRRAFHSAVAKAYHDEALRLLRGAYETPARRGRTIQERMDSVLLNPWTGFPILAAVVFFGLYLFVGVLGAGVLVGFLEETVFGGWVTPLFERLADDFVPWPVVRELFVGDFGLLTLGLRYALAIILPVVGTFFLAFSVLEDTGYLPRMAMMLDRVFKKLGLNGRAVIPLVLGFGCDTMATMVTRILETRRERLIATFLLALSVPCSAQLGLLLALLSGHPAALLLWGLILAGVFLAAGTILSRYLPGERPAFFMELPPLRWPSAKNVWNKTVSRMGWYFLEIFPVFMLASLLIWAGKVTGLFPLLTKAMIPGLGLMGLPPETAPAVLLGFFRRDYGAAGLYDLQRQGVLDGNQLLVAAVTLTLFLPCVAQFLVMKKERGWKVTLGTSAVILVVAFSVGWTLSALLRLSGVAL